MADRTFADEARPSLLGQALSGDYTQVFTEAFENAERLVFIVIAHASGDVEIDVTIAEDSSGTTPVEILAAAVTLDTAGECAIIEVDAAQLTELTSAGVAAKRFISLKVTHTAGTYTVLQIKRGLRDKGNLTHDSTIDSTTEALG